MKKCQSTIKFCLALIVLLGLTSVAHSDSDHYSVHINALGDSSFTNHYQGAGASFRMREVMQVAADFYEANFGITFRINGTSTMFNSNTDPFENNPDVWSRWGSPIWMTNKMRDYFLPTKGGQIGRGGPQFTINLLFHRRPIGRSAGWADGLGTLNTNHANIYVLDYFPGRPRTCSPIPDGNGGYTGETCTQAAPFDYGVMAVAEVLIHEIAHLLNAQHPPTDDRGNPLNDEQETWCENVKPHLMCKATIGTRAWNFSQINWDRIDDYIDEHLTRD